MRRDQRVGPPLQQRLEHRQAQGRPLLRVRSAAQLVQQHEARGVRGEQRGLDPDEMAREGGEVLADLLLVADVGEDAVVQGDGGALGRGHREPQPRQQGEEAGRLHGHGLPPRVGARDQEQVEVVPHAQVDGDDLVQLTEDDLMHQQGVPRGAEREPRRGPLVPRLERHHSTAPQHVARSDQAELDLRQDRGERLDLRALVEHAPRELEQDALGLATQVAPQLGEPVPRLHHLTGLDEHALAAAGAVVHETADPTGEARLHGQHGATLAAMHGRVAEHRPDVRPSEDVLEMALDARRLLLHLP